MSGCDVEKSGRMQVGTVRRFSTQSKVWMDDAWTVERSGGISRRPDGCKGSDFSDLKTV
jgi:hypothetical protein